MQMLLMRNPHYFFLFSWSVSWLLFAVYVLTYTPLAAWDGLSFWAPQAINVASYPTSQWWPIATGLASTTPLFVLSSAVVVKYFPEAGFVSPFAILLFALSFFWCLITVLKFKSLRSLKKMPLIFFASLASLPIVENMYLAAGYPDIFIYVVVGFVTMQIFSISSKSSLARKAVLICLLLLLVGIKETGIVYLATFLLSLVFFVLIRSSWNVKWLIVSTIVTCGVFAVFNSGYVVHIFDLKFGIRIYEEVVVLHFAEKRLALIPQSIHSVIVNTFFAVFVNASFSIVSWMYFSLSFLFVNQKQYGISRGDSSALLIILIWAVFTVFASLLGQILVPYVHAVASVGADTGGTRLLLPITACISFSFIYLSSRLPFARGDQPSEQ